MKKFLATLALTALLAVLAVVPFAEPASAAIITHNGRIVFARQVNGNTQIFSMEPDGSDVTQLTFSPGNSASPKVSPDGRFIVFSSTRDSVSQNLSALYVMELNGGRQSRITPAGQLASSPSWSPDGRKLVYGNQAQNGSYEIFKVNRDGSNITQLTSDQSQYDRSTQPDWSPERDKIAYIHFTNDGEVSSLRTMSPDGSNVQTLLEDNGTGRHISGPRWSSDGTKLAVERIELTNESVEASNIEVLNADGSNVHSITNNTDGNVDYQGPTWAPEGNKVAYAKSTDTSNYFTHIFSANTDGSNAMQLTTGPSYNSMPDWQAELVSEQ